MSCACKRPSVPTTPFRSSASSGSATRTSRSTARRAITASSCSRACRSRASTRRVFAARRDCRHVSAVLGERAGLRDPITVHNFYVPAGGDIPDPAINPKFAHKLAFLDEMRDHADAPAGAVRALDPGRRSQCGAARARRLEPQADVARGVAHARSSAKSSFAVQTAGGWVDSMRRFVAGAGQALYLVELPHRPIGRPPTRAAASTTSGPRRCWPTASPP